MQAIQASLEEFMFTADETGCHNNLGDMKERTNEPPRYVGRKRRKRSDGRRETATAAAVVAVAAAVVKSLKEKNTNWCNAIV